MSGDVQPRRRKDKKKKRDSLDRKSEGEIFDNKKEEDDVKESHHGVHAAKLGADDVLLHVQDEHVTGGHWCAKILFFSLLAILIGLIGLIIMENRGLADLDTPLSKSRYSEYFEGWVDEHRQTHDEHSKIADELEEGNYNEAFKDEEDDDHDGSEEHHEHHEDENIEHDDNDDEGGEEEEDEEELKEDKDDQDEIEETNDEEVKADEEDEESDVQTNKDEDDIEEEIYSRIQNTDDNDVDDDNKDEEQNDEDIVDDNDNENDKPLDQNLHTNNEEIKYDFGNGDDPFDEIEDDANEEDIVDNDREELEHLEKKSKEQDDMNKADSEEQNEDEENSSSLAVKFIVGLALAFVAHLVLIKKRDNKTNEQETDAEILMKRRLTIVTHEESIFQDEDELIDDDIENERIDDYDNDINEKYYDHNRYLEDIDNEIDQEKHENLSSSQMISDEINSIYFPKKITNLKNENEQKFKMLFDKDEINENDRNLLKKFDTESNKSEELKISTAKELLKDQLNTGLIQRTEDIKQKIVQTVENIEKNKSRQEEIQDMGEEEDEGEEEEEEEEEIDDDEEIEIGEGGDDEDNEEEEEEEDDEEDVEFDVEDDELMRRLDEKYGKLPTYDSEEDDEEDIDDKSWTKIKSRRDNRQHDNNYDQSSINEQLRRAEKEESENNLKSSLNIYESLLLKYPNNPGALYGKAKILDRLSEKYQSNHILNDAIEAYKKFLVTVNNKSITADITAKTTTTTTKTTTTVTVDNAIFKNAAERCIDRMRFKGLHLNAVPVHQMLIKRFNDDPYYRNQLAVTYLLVNRLTDAKNVLHETLSRWPNNGFAQVHYGFVLKNLDNNLEESIKYLRLGIESKENGTQDGRFYFHLGDALQRLGRNDEAKLIYRQGAEMKLFLSEYQRSLYNVNGLKAKPFWTKKETTYETYFDILEKNWEKIRDEGLNILNSKGLFINEVENLKEKGDWKQFELFARGFKNTKNCEKVPFTCKLIESFPAARYCKRGQTKFSVIHPGTHVWPHCGPTNCRLRAHLGLKIPSGTKIRVANEERTWKEGKFLIFDDSFEHEVWHNGTSLRLVFIVDIWHPELTDEQKRTLSLI